MAMICNKCNHQLPDDSEFCQYCGNNLSVVIEQPKVHESTIVTPISINSSEGEPLEQIDSTLSSSSASQNELNNKLGLFPNSPIYTNGIDQQHNYLQCLRSIDGDTLKWVLRGSISVDGIQGVVNIYDAYLSSGNEYKTVYLNANGIACPAYAPKGFSYVNTPVAVPHANKSTPSTTTAHKPRSNKVLLTVGIVFLALIIIAAITAAIAIPMINNAKLDDQYKNLQQAMQSINGSNYKDIGIQIEEFPLDYRDIDSIKSEYNQIKKNIEVIQATQAYSSYSTMTERNCNALRNAYANLMDINSQNSDWDLSKYLENVHDKYLLNFVFGIEWKTSDYDIFYWHEGDGGEEWLETGLPNDESDDKDYYYYVSTPDKFGYENQKNSSDKFLAYRITDVIYSNKTWQIKIYCYSESRTYTLSPSGK